MGTILDEVGQKSALASTVRWGRYLPELVFKRRPQSFFFFDRGFIERRGLIEGLASWSFRTSADDVLVSLGHSRLTGEFDQHLIQQSFRHLTRGGVDAELERLRSEWSREQQWALGTAIMSTRSQDWMLYEDHLEEVGVLALYSSSSIDSRFQQFLDSYFFSVREIKDQLSGADASQHLILLFGRDFLRRLAENFTLGESEGRTTPAP